MKYKTIVIDFPWDIKTGHKRLGKFDRRGKSFHKFADFALKLPYGTMTNDEIMNFNINDFAESECDLFLWVTHSTLPIGLEYCKKWGFKYHVLMTWDKGHGLSMFGFNRNTEFIIYAFRGKMGIKRDKGPFLNTIIKEHHNPSYPGAKGAHSAKPSLFYQTILKHTKEPRIDIFARRKHQGFDSYGNEAQEPMTITAFTVEG